MWNPKEKVPGKEKKQTKAQKCRGALRLIRGSTQDVHVCLRSLQHRVVVSFVQAQTSDLQQAALM